MGWDGIELRNETPAQFVRRDLEAAGNEVLRLYQVGPAVYAAVRLAKPDTINQAGDVIALVIATRHDGRYCWFKWMHEAEGPCYYDAPAELLEVLTPTDCGWAPAWRARCRETIADRAAGRPARVHLLAR
jgi:hypothetical protein